MILEALEVDAPHDHCRSKDIRTFGVRVGRVIPAEWWSCNYVAPVWINVCQIPWWRLDVLWRLAQLNPSPHYWPLRLRIRSRVVWSSKAAKKWEHRND